MNPFRNVSAYIHNPLGIIGMFITLVYGFAALLLGTNVNSFPQYALISLIAFIVIFPILILVVFYLLVTRHWRKLYAPRDYRHDSSFLKLSEEETETKVEQEVEELLLNTELDKKQSINKTRYAEIEADAIGIVENELGIDAEKNVKLMPSGVTFDAVIRSDDRVTAIEVKILERPHFPYSIYKVLHNGDIADDFLISFKLILVLVCLFPEKQIDTIKSKYEKVVSRSLFPVKLKWISQRQIEETES